MATTNNDKTNDHSNGDDASSWPPSAGLSTPTIPSSATVLFLSARTTIRAPAPRVFATIRRPSTWPQWNTFCPSAEIEDPDADPDLLHGGTKFVVVAVLDPRKPQKRATSSLLVSDVSVPGEESGYLRSGEAGEVYRVAWRSNRGPPGLRAERFCEVWPRGDGECEVRTWECMGGVLAHVVKWMYGGLLVERFRDWVGDLKGFCERGE